MRKFSIAMIAALLFFGVGVGCQSDDGAQQEDDKAEAQQPASEEEGDEEGEKEEKEKEEEGEEHPGDEHPGDEHPGEDHEEGDEHPGDEHPGDSAKKDKKDFTASDIKKAMTSHIDAESNDDGVFTIEDTQEGTTLELKFVKIHDPVRKMEGKGYFGCTDFHVKGNEDKVYDLDFWLNPKDGKLKVTKSKVHKHPVKKDGEWTKKARYTFQDDKIVALD